MLRRTPLPLRIALLALPLPAALAAATGPWREEQEARVRLVSSWDAAPAGADAGLGLEFELQPGWHVYWRNPGDAGYPPKLDFVAGVLADDAELLFPAPERFVLPGDLMSFGYESAVVYPVDARLAPAAGPRPPIRAKLDYLVCAESCVPHRAELELALPAGDAREDAATAARIDLWRARLPEPPNADGAPHATGRLESGPGSDLTLVVAFAGGELDAAAPDLFFAIHPLAQPGRPEFVAGRDGPGFRVPLRRFDGTQPWPEELALEWTATGFVRAGREVAFAGRFELPRPAPPAGELLAAPWIRLTVAVAAVFVVALALRRLRAARPAPPDTA